MRFSNVLDGLFHRAVVLAEADADCRFYSAALFEADLAEELNLSPSEVLFVPSGGKQGMAKLARALSAVAVPVIASPDLDILNDAAVLRDLVVALGAEWEPLEADYRVACQPFTSGQLDWDQIKKYGQAAFKGQAGASASTLLDNLDRLGIVGVRVGEMEGFANDLDASKGPAWLSAALEAEVHKRPEVRAHIARIISGRDP